MIFIWLPKAITSIVFDKLITAIVFNRRASCFIRIDSEKSLDRQRWTFLTRDSRYLAVTFKLAALHHDHFFIRHSKIIQCITLSLHHISIIYFIWVRISSTLTSMFLIIMVLSNDPALTQSTIFKFSDEGYSGYPILEAFVTVERLQGSFSNHIEAQILLEWY